MVVLEYYLTSLMVSEMLIMGISCSVHGRCLYKLVSLYLKASCHLFSLSCFLVSSAARFDDSFLNFEIQYYG